MISQELDRRAQYMEEFKKAGIDGLHLLELSVSEMGGLGVKFVSHQRRLADKIDGERNTIRHSPNQISLNRTEKNEC